MINEKTKLRELCYITRIDSIEPIEGKDRVECARVGGWTVMVRKDQFKPGDLGIYFEIDSKVPATEPFEFLAGKHYKIKTQGYRNPDGSKFYSQGLLMHPRDFGGFQYQDGDGQMYLHFGKDSYFKENNDYGVGEFLTAKLGVTYAVDDDNKRKAKKNPDAKINSALSRHPCIAKKYGRYIKKNKIAKHIFLLLFGRKKDVTATAFPTHLDYVKKTDQERVENMTWVLQDKTPYIVTQKCDGSSGTFILERKKNLFGTKYEFYVCSRNVRQLSPKQQSYYDENYYWECALKYDIENKLKDYLKKNPDLNYVCWQGEVCSPQIQKNPQGLTETHLFCFHMIDSKRGKYDIRDAAKIWKEYDMEIVPIVNENYILPDDIEEFKKSAEAFYDPSVCEGKTTQKQEGYVYYKTDNPDFSFKNVSREYLMKHS